MGPAYTARLPQRTAADVMPVARPPEPPAPAGRSTPLRVDASVESVRRQFDRRAARFGRHDALLREVERRMEERLALMRLPVSRALATGSVDVVFSNLMLHWHPAPHEVIGEMGRVLRAGGLALFSSYGPDTLRELRAACAASLRAARPMPYVDMHDLGDMLVAAGFESPVMEVEKLDLTYGSAHALLEEARALGGNPRADRDPALPSGVRARALLHALAAAAGGGRPGLHFEIVIGHGWKGQPRSAGVATILPPPARRRTP